MQKSKFLNCVIVACLGIIVAGSTKYVSQKMCYAEADIYDGNYHDIAFDYDNDNDIFEETDLYTEEREKRNTTSAYIYNNNLGGQKMNNKINQLKELIQKSNNIVFFGGAGVSTESNIPDFRSSSGLFSERLNKNFTPEQLVSHTFFVRYPDEFFKFYKDKLIYQDAKPNNAHKALAKLEEIGKLKAVVTQNIDGLHQMAGSKTVYELHGSVHRNYCTKCHKFFDLDSMLALDGNIPHCDKCGGVVKPDVVLYEEGLDNSTIEGAIRAISSADLLIIGGTSLVVYPAASFINYYRGKDMVLINKSSTGYDNEASLVINDAIGEVLKEAVLDVYK